ncbi:proteoglycan 4-like [Frankliniella occidentalis]|uniref:Proteoglycan 4-like n=1 Tax=Frankliniella occidentalis TaxID=133901 RepID=A0A9C6U7V6_FRAOC|nr:proteoglycan 4-like [Frankliniella occidentalis]
MGLKFLAVEEEFPPLDIRLPVEEPAEHLLPNLEESDAVPVVTHQLPEEPASQLLPILVQSEPLSLEDYPPLALEAANGHLLLESPPLASPLELGPPAVTVSGPPSDPFGSPTTPSLADRTEFPSDIEEYITLTPPQSLECPPAPVVRMRLDCLPQQQAVLKQLPTVPTLERVPPPIMLRMQTAQVTAAQLTAQPLPSPSDDADSGLGSPLSTIHSDESCDSDSSPWVKSVPSFVVPAATTEPTRPKRPPSKAAAQRPSPRARSSKVATRSKARPPAPPAAEQPTEPGQVQKYSGPRTGVCTVCGKHNKRLDKHMMVHNRWKPHKCNLCSYAATQSEHLARHKQRHNETKDPSRTLHCPVCNKSLSRKDKLRDHMRQHE